MKHMTLFPIKFSVSNRIKASSAYEISNTKLYVVEGCFTLHSNTPRNKHGWLEQNLNLSIFKHKA